MQKTLVKIIEPFCVSFGTILKLYADCQTS